MLKWLRTRAKQSRKADELYGAVVAQARSRKFYTEMGVPDSVEGRFEMIVLHLFCLLESLKDAGVAERDLSRLIVERFVTDLDDAMREMSVGDVKVAKKVKQAAATFYDRSGSYRTAIAAAREGDMASLERTIVEVIVGKNQNDRIVMADYVMRTSDDLAAQSYEDLLAMGPAFRSLGEC